MVEAAVTGASGPGGKHFFVRPRDSVPPTRSSKIVGRTVMSKLRCANSTRPGMPKLELKPAA